MRGYKTITDKEMIPKEKIEELRDRVNIVQVISEYMPLKKRGVNWFGICPFHSEKSPSFSVNEEKKIFYCFGCHETGSAITFIMKKDGLTFPDAVRTLAARFGVVIKEEKRAVSGVREALFAVNRAAMEFFAGKLLTGEGKRALSYLQGRGFGDRKLLEEFNIGYAPGAWEALTAYLKRKGFSMETAVTAGLVHKKSRGYYDRFRGRLIFPITDIRGRVTGFGGRVLDDSLPKYLNSPETILFKKGHTLFGLYQAKKDIAKLDSAIVVEGYFDLMAMHRFGFTNTVATMGTALTAGHLRALKGYAGSVYCLFDADEAGVKAALRGLGLFLDEEIRCLVVTLEGAKDPDEFLLKNDSDAMGKALELAVPLMEFYLRELKGGFKLATPAGKRGYLGAAMPYLKRIVDVAERGHYVSIVASSIGIPPASIYEALRTGRAGPGRGRGAPSGTGAVKRITDLKGSGLAEFTILKVILKHPEFLDEGVREAVGMFRDEGLREAGMMVCEHCSGAGGLDISALVDRFEEVNLRSDIKSGLLGDDEGFIESPEKMLKDSLKKVLNRGKLKSSTREMIKRLEESGKMELADIIRKRVQKGFP